MKSWFIKQFKSKVNAKIIFKTKEGRLKSFYVIPKGGEVDIAPYGTFILDTSKMYLSDKNTPTYLFIEGIAEPINIESKEQSFMTPQRYKKAIDNKVVSEIIGATEDAVLSKETMIIIGILVLGFLGLGYMFNDKINLIIEFLTSQNEVVIP
jgi:hypothetical protein